MLLWNGLDELGCADDGIRLWLWEIKTEINGFLINEFLWLFITVA